MKVTVKPLFKLNFIFSLLVTVTVSVQAQTTAPPQEEEPITALGLDDQFKRINDDSETFKQYKVIEKGMLNDFWGRVKDSVTHYHNEISQLSEQKSQLEQAVSTANQTISKKDELLSANDFEKQHINVLGINFTKGTYIQISFLCFSLAIAVLGFFVYKYKQGNKITVKAKNEYEDLGHKFEQYKKEALDKQMKLRRDLQTESNKLHELQQKIGSLK